MDDRTGTSEVGDMDGKPGQVKGQASKEKKKESWPD